MYPETYIIDAQGKVLREDRRRRPTGAIRRCSRYINSLL